MSFKVGDKVTGTRDYQVMDGKVATITYVVAPGRYRLDEGSPLSIWHDSELKLVKEGDDMEFKVNDIVVYKDGDFRKILAVSEHGYGLSDWSSLKSTAEQFDGEDFDIWETSLSDYKIANNPKEVTLEEVAKKFGVDVSEIRIKD